MSEKRATQARMFSLRQIEKCMFQDEKDFTFEP